MLANFWYWRLAIFECATDAYIAGAMVWMAAIADKEWGSLSPTAKHLIMVAVSVAALKIVKSFLSNTMNLLKNANRSENITPPPNSP